jgi:alkanesulfonate monooxygenase SsuD/methylene tetrahydromethanopterin reductase-like flavin-dependent oxidoreductase (luciferase family)
MKLGLMVEAQEGVGWQLWRDIVRWADSLGFESLWRSDHFFSLTGARGLDSLETFVSLAYAATHSERIRFGPLVCPMTFRHPAMMARMAAAIDELSGGRFILGLGAGWYAPEHRAFGIALPPQRARIQALDEGAAMIRRLLREDTVSFTGDYFRLHDAQIRPQGSQTRLPLLIGGGGEKHMLAVVARRADEWNVPGMSIERYRRKVAVLLQHCKRESRDAAHIARSIVYTHVIAKSQAKAQQLAEELATQIDPRYRPGAAPDSPVWLVGSPEQVVDQIRALEREGVYRIMLQYRIPPRLEDLEFIAREVLPYV